MSLGLEKPIIYMFCKNFILKEQLNIEKMSTISDGQGSKHHCEEVAKENKFWNQNHKNKAISFFHEGNVYK